MKTLLDIVPGRSTRSFYLILWTAGVLFLSGVACSSAPDTTDDEQQRAARQARPAQPPTEDELTDGPCGNPDWAKLPEGADGKSGRVGKSESSPAK